MEDGKGRLRLTGVIKSDHYQDQGPDVDGEEGGPAVIICIDAAADGEDEVAVDLHYVNQDHIDDRKGEANRQFDQQLSAPLGLRWIHVGPVDI